MASARQHRILAIVATDASYEARAAGDARVWVGKCIFCGRALTIGDDGTPVSRATLEHIWPRHHGGDDRLENLALACAGCNHEKGTRHDHRRKDDPRLAEIAGELARKRRERWREGDDGPLAAHVRWVRTDEARRAAPAADAAPADDDLSRTRRRSRGRRRRRPASRRRGRARSTGAGCWR